MKGDGHMKIVFHIDETEKWDMLLANIENIIKYSVETKTDFKVEVVANGIAVTKYLDANYNKRITNIISPCIQFAACHNALIANDIDEQLLPPYIRVVPAGVVELAILQDSGFRYIKP